MPTPRPLESESHFVSRCMAYPDLQNKQPDQRAAICYSLYKQHRGKKDYHEYIYKINDTNYGLDIATDKLEWNDDEHSIVIAFAASLGQDRKGDFLEVKGIECANHKNNPVAFLDHGLREMKPIGKCQDLQGNYTVEITDDVAYAKIFLAVDIPDYVLPLQCYELYKKGILKAGSIGFQVLDSDVIPPAPEKGYRNKAMHIKRCELVEVSLVAIPMNQDTVQKYLNEDLCGQPLAPCLKSLIQPLSGSKRKIWIHGIHKNMDNAMSATDQAHGGAFVGDDKDKDKDKDKEEKSGYNPSEEADGSQDSQPHGARVLASVHDILHSAKEYIDSNRAQLEHPGVSKLVDKMYGDLDKHCKNCAEEYAKSYPDLDELRHEEGEEAESADEEEQSEEMSEEDTEKVMKLLDSIETKLLHTEARLSFSRRPYGK